MEKKKYSEYDKKECYEKEIQPYIERIVRLLRHYEIPYAFFAAISSNNEKTEYIVEMCGARPMGLHLKNDKLPDFINVMNGFKTEMPDEIVEIDL